jgi:hypothetical protein
LLRPRPALDGDLDASRAWSRLTGFVNAAPGFGQHPEVVNGASELFVGNLRRMRRHSRRPWASHRCRETSPSKSKRFSNST